MWGANSESSGTNSIPGIDGPGPANAGVKSDSVSRVAGSRAEVSNYGAGSFIAGGGSSSTSTTTSEAEEKKKKSKSFWKGVLKK